MTSSRKRNLLAASAARAILPAVIDSLVTARQPKDAEADGRGPVAWRRATGPNIDHEAGART